VDAHSWARSVEAFAAAAAWFAATASHVGDRWDDPGLGEWTVRDLVGHTGRALLTVESYLGHEPPAVEVDGPVAYFRRVLDSGDPAATARSVAQRGREAGAALGPDPAAAVAQAADRVVALVRRTAADTPLPTPAGGMLLRDYLPTRTFELTVHTCDLAAAVGADDQVPPLAAGETLTLVGALAMQRGQVADLLLATTGRRGLPPGFSVL
jgi:uncharacterized protein (TIGR03083 family)